MDQWTGVVLAAGDGTRMKSRLSKVLHRVCGKPMVRYPLDLMARLGIQRRIVVVSPSNRDPVREELGDDVKYVTQPEANGTGGAIAQARGLLEGLGGHLLVMAADAPLVRADSVKTLMSKHIISDADMTLLTCRLPSGGDFGRVLRDRQGHVTGIVEAADWKRRHTRCSRGQRQRVLLRQRLVMGQH